MPRLPLIRLQLPQSTWRFWLWLVLPFLRAMMWSTARCYRLKCSPHPAQNPSCSPYNVLRLAGLVCDGIAPRSVRRGMSVRTVPFSHHADLALQPLRCQFGALWRDVDPGPVALSR